MLIKLLKYDFKDLFKSLVPIYLVSFLVAFLTRVFNFAADKISLLKFPAGIISGLSIILIIGIPIATIILCISRYYKNMVKDEGYLTHTLPVKKGSLIISKLIVATVFMFVSILASISVIFLAFNIDIEIFDSLFKFIREIYEYDYLIVYIIAITLIISHINNLLLVYTSISLGQMHSGNKAIYSIIYGVVLYNVSQILSALLIFAPSLFIKDYIKKLDESNIDINYLNGFLIYVVIIIILMSIAYYIICKKSMEKKLNLD